MRTEASEIQVNLVFCCSAHESSHSIFEDIVDIDQFRWVFVRVGRLIFRFHYCKANGPLWRMTLWWEITGLYGPRPGKRSPQSLQSTTGLAIPMPEEYFLPLHSHVTEDVTSAKKRLLHHSWEGAWIMSGVWVQPFSVSLVLICWPEEHNRGAWKGRVNIIQERHRIVRKYF